MAAGNQRGKGALNGSDALGRAKFDQGENLSRQKARTFNPFDPFGSRMEVDASGARDTAEDRAAAEQMRAWEKTQKAEDAKDARDLAAEAARVAAAGNAAAGGAQGAAMPGGTGAMPGGAGADVTLPAPAASGDEQSVQPGIPQFGGDPTQTGGNPAQTGSNPAPAGSEGDGPAPASEAPAGEPLRYKVHHSYIWLGSLRAVFVVVAAIVVSQLSVLAELASDISNVGGFFGVFVGLAVAAGVLLVIAGCVVGYHVLSYRHLYYTIGQREFSLYRGILNKQRVHVPYQRVQSVDQKASLLQRLLGVCTVTIDTAGGSANKAITVPYVTRQQAEWIRAELFARKRLVASGAYVPEGVSAAAIAAAAVGGTAPGGIPAAAAFGVAPVPSAAAVVSAQLVGDAAASSAVPASVAPGTNAPAASAAPGIAPAAPASAASGDLPAAPAPPSPVPGNVLDAGDEIWRELGGVFGGAEVDTGRVLYEYGLTNKELLLAGLSNNTAFLLVLIGLVGALTQVGDVLFGLFPDVGPGIMDAAVSQAAGFFGGGLVFVIAGALCVAAVVLWAVSGIASCISYGGFKARRRESRIEVEHGLLNHTFQGIDIDRVQSVVIKQGFVRRCIGYCEISLGKIDAVTSNEESSGNTTGQSGVVIHPFVKIDRVPEILAGIIPEYADVPTDVQPPARVALRRALIRRCIWQGDGFWLAIIVSAVYVPFVHVLGVEGIANLFDVSVEGASFALGFIAPIAYVLYAVAVVAFVLNAVGAVLWFRESSFGYNWRFMQVTTGGFSRETVSFPRQKIQFGFTSANPFQRMAHVATVNARTAAGIGGNTVRMMDVEEAQAARWLAWVCPRGNMLK